MNKYLKKTFTVGLPIFQVALHEIGHSLGLKHSKKKDAVMWPLYGYKSNKNISLDEEDVHRIHVNIFYLPFRVFQMRVFLYPSFLLIAIVRSRNHQN